MFWLVFLAAKTFQLLMTWETKDKLNTYLWLCDGAAFCGCRRDTASFESESSMHITSLTSFSCWESMPSTGRLIGGGGVTGVIGGVSLNKMLNKVSTYLTHAENTKTVYPPEPYRTLAGAWS